MNHSVKELCSVYEVSRSGYYKWKNRKGALNRYDIRHMKIDYLVDDIHSKHPSQGYRSIADTIFNEHNLRFSDYSVMKSMQRLNIKGFVRKQKNSSPEGEEHKKFPNILNRNFNADKPMKKIVTDVTYIKYKNRWYYLACFLDLYNNEIIDWELSDKFDNFLVMKPAGRILEKTKSTESQILFHSDQGVQYSSAGYCNLLNLTTLFSLCQELVTQEITLLLNLSSADSKMFSFVISNIGNHSLLNLLLPMLFIILITKDLFVN